MKKRVILVSHGELSKGMMNSVQMIVGQNEELFSYSLMPGKHYAEIVESIENEVKENKDTQFIIIADLYGGSVCNGCTALVKYENVKLISGMNIGLVIGMLLASAPVTDEYIALELNSSKEGIKYISNDFIKEQLSDKCEEFF